MNEKLALDELDTSIESLDENAEIKPKDNGVSNDFLALVHTGDIKAEGWLTKNTPEFVKLQVLSSGASLASQQLPESPLSYKSSLAKKTSRILKRSFDIVGAAFLMILLAPIFLIVSVLIRQTGKQVIYKHERIGRNGKSFNCLKFRSMVENSDVILKDLLNNNSEARDEWQRDFKLKKDPRITSIGRFLRRTSLDELPQLLNVIKGDMSLVGPRPVVDEEISYYGSYADFYYDHRPGITGLWQVSGRNDIDYEGRVKLDVWYVTHWSFLKDLVILFKTVGVVFSKKGAY